MSSGSERDENVEESGDEGRPDVKDLSESEGGEEEEEGEDGDGDGDGKSSNESEGDSEDESEDDSEDSDEDEMASGQKILSSGAAISTGGKSVKKSAEEKSAEEKGKGKKKKEGKTPSVASDGSEGEGEGKKKKRASPGKGKKQPSYVDMITKVIFEHKDKRGISVQTLKKLMTENFSIQAQRYNQQRFNQQLSLAMKKMLSSGSLIKGGARYKLNPKISSKIRSEETRKEKLAKEADFQKRLKAGKVTLEEVAEHKRNLEEEKKKKEDKAAREKERLAKRKAERSADGQGGDGESAAKKRGPRPMIPKNDLAFGNVAGALLAIVEFCSEFSDVLKLMPFTVDMLFNALNCSHVTTLLREIHLVFLALCLEPEMNQHEIVVRWDWFKILNSLTWQEVLRRYLIRAIDLLGKEYPPRKHLSLVIEHLEAKSYVSLPIEAKVAALRVLVDDCNSHPEILEAVEEKAKTRNDLSLTKWHQEHKAQREYRKLKEDRSNLEKGEMPPEKSEDDEDEKSEGEEDEEQESDEEESTKTKSKGAKKTSKETKGTKGKAKKQTKKQQSDNEKKEKAPVSKRAIEAMKQEIDKKLEAFSKEKERRQEQYLHDLSVHRVRADPLGFDCCGNSFWSFSCDPTRLYIHGTKVKGESAPELKSKTWRYYDSIQEIDKLILSCDTSSKREKSLKRELTFFYDSIVANMKKPETADTAAVSGKKKKKKKEESNETPVPTPSEDDKAVSNEVEPSKSEDGANGSNADEDDESENGVSLLDRLRPKRGAARVAEEQIKAQYDPSLLKKNEEPSENGDGSEVVPKKKRRRRRQKTWEDTDPDAFEKYQNLLNDVDGLELDLDNPTPEQKESSLDDPDVKLFKDAEKNSVASRVLTKDLCELADFLESRGGKFVGLVTNIDDFHKMVKDALEVTPVGQAGCGSEDSTEEDAKSQSDALLGVRSRTALQKICALLENVATDAIIESKKANAKKEAARKERLLLAQQRKKEEEKARKKAALERKKRNAERRMKASSKRKKELAARSGKSGKRSRSSKHRRSSRKRQKPEVRTTWSGRAARVNYNEDALMKESNNSEGSEDDEDDFSVESDDSGPSIEEEIEEEEEEEEEEEDAEEDGDEEKKASNIQINDDIDVPEAEAERIALLQHFENMFEIGTKLRCEIASNTQSGLKSETADGAEKTEESELRDSNEQVKPERVVNGVLEKFSAATFLSPSRVKDRWLIRLEDGSPLWLDERSVRIAIQQYSRFEADNKVAMATPVDEASVKAEVEEEKVVKPKDEAADKAVRFFWGTKTEREAWFECIDAAMTCSSWAAIFYQLYNRVHINNSLQEE